MKLGTMTMKVRFAALAAFLLASAFPQLGHAQGYIQIPVPGIPGVGSALLLRKNENIGGGGSIASTFGTENTSFATGWPIRRPIAKSEEDWSTGLAKCITSESSAGTVENQNGSDLIPGDEPVLARFGKAHDGPSAVTEADTHPAAFFCGCARSRIAVDEVGERSRTLREQRPECSPFTWRGSRISGVAISSRSIARAVITSPCCRRSFCSGLG